MFIVDPRCEVNMRIRSSAILPCLASVPIAALLAGCAGMSPTATNVTDAPLTIKGIIHGGQQPIVGAHVYLLQVNTTGNAGSGIAASTSNASISTLDPTSTMNSDAIGAYVLSGAGGGFSITGEYQCTAGAQYYLYALGGNSGSGTNSAAGLLAGLGACPATQSFAGSTPYVFMNEVSTVAAAYSMAGYATDATHVSTDNSTAAITGITNAMLNGPNLATLATGTALATTPAGNGTVPQSTINAIANILASCINTSSSTSAQCTTLFSNTKSGGSTGTTPTDTATAAINIAHNPAANVSALFSLITASPVFAPTLPYVPNDLLIGINYSGAGTGGGLNGAYAIAIDAQGAAWFTNVNNRSVTKLASNGVPLSPATGFATASGGLPTGIAIDLSGNAWVCDSGNNNLTKFSSGGLTLSPAGGYTGGNLGSPQGLAIDAGNNIWVVNLNMQGTTSSVSKFNSSGVAENPAGYTGGGIDSSTSIAIDNSSTVWVTNQQPTPGTITRLNNSGLSLGTGANPYGTGAGLNNPQGVAIDASNNAWIANYGDSSISEFNVSGTAVSGTSGFTGGGTDLPKGLAVDGGGNIWVANPGNSVISEFTNAGVAISPSTGFAVGGVNGPVAVEIDPSGDVWIANTPPSGSSVNSVTELIGAGIPRITPLSAALAAGKLGTRP